MRRLAVVKPAWRARRPDLRRQKDKQTVGVSIKTHETIMRAAADAGMSARRYADAVIMHCLDAAGAP